VSIKEIFKLIKECQVMFSFNKSKNSGIPLTFFWRRPYTGKWRKMKFEEEEFICLDEDRERKREEELKGTINRYKNIPC